MPKSTIRYTRKDRTPSLKHYPVSRNVLYTDKKGLQARIVEPKYHTVVRVEGYEFDYAKNKWVKGTRYVTLAHNEHLKRRELEQQSETICQQTSEQFQIRKSVIVRGRRSPLYEEVSA